MTSQLKIFIALIIGIILGAILYQVILSFQEKKKREYQHVLFYIKRILEEINESKQADEVVLQKLDEVIEEGTFHGKTLKRIEGVSALIKQKENSKAVAELEQMVEDFESLISLEGEEVINTSI